MGVQFDTLKKWEYGKRNPSPIARILMILMDRDPALLEIMAEISGVDLEPIKRGRPRK